jgi:hypothetical protein
MTEILNNALYILVGMLLGLFLGWTLRTMQYAREARDHARKLNEHGWITRRLSLVVVLLLTATAAIWTGVVNTQQHKSQNCTEQAVSGIVQALNDRTSLSNKLSLADASQNKAFSKLMAALLSEPQPDKDVLKGLFRDYANKLNRYLGLQDSLRTSQAQNPYPKSIDYHNCLEGG